MSKYHFINENSHRNKIKTLIISFIFIVFMVLITTFFIVSYNLGDQNSFLQRTLFSLKGNLVDITPTGLFYENFIGGIFFIPSPDEVIFYYALLKGNNPWLILISAVAGYMIAQVFNYIFGLKISNFVLNLVSKKKVYKTRRFANKYGSYGIFLFNFLPLPAPLLTFALGIAKYNSTRLLTITLLGKIAKYISLIIIFYVISK